MPADFDALVIGAGPAGSVAALELARGGARVALVDRSAFPRDKTCGDALIPDALAMLTRLSVAEAVLARAHIVQGVRVYAPSGRCVTIRGQCASLPRAVLDDVLRIEAVSAGASFFPGYRVKAPFVDDGVVRGASFDIQGRRVEVRAGVTVLATGGAAEVLQAFDVCERPSPSAIAARMYVTVDAATARTVDHLCISYDKEICPGYGWIFPGPRNTFNVGVGYFSDTQHRLPESNIRRLFDRFMRAFAPAGALMRGALQASPLKGAPLRTAMAGATLAKPGLLVIGEAAGLTYSFSGEGIGKAMESGLIAAQAILSASDDRARAAEAAATRYATILREAFASRFRAYKTAQEWLSRPAMVNFLAWQANRSRFVSQQLEALFQETADPRELFSASGVLRGLLRPGA